MRCAVRSQPDEVERDTGDQGPLGTQASHHHRGNMAPALLSSGLGSQGFGHGLSRGLENKRWARSPGQNSGIDSGAEPEIFRSRSVSKPKCWFCSRSQSPEFGLENSVLAVVSLLQKLRCLQHCVRTSSTRRGSRGGVRRRYHHRGNVLRVSTVTKAVQQESHPSPGQRSRYPQRRRASDTETGRRAAL